MKKPQLLYYDMGAADVVAFSTTRRGGYSLGKYGEFNINTYCGDSPAHVISNRTALACELGIDEARIIMPHQTHGVGGVVVDERFFSLAPEQRLAALEGRDYIATGMRGVCIGVSTADCVPVLIYCDETATALCIHAGWRGTLSGISRVAVSEMEARSMLIPENCRAVIGPSISLNAFEVGDEVCEAFRSAGFPMREISRRQGGRWHIDLWKANAMQLASVGIKEENISMSGVCTYSRSRDFFSARRLGAKSGRIFSGILIK